MFSNIISLVLVLLMVSMLPQKAIYRIEDATLAFGIGMGLYALLMLLFSGLALWIKRRGKPLRALLLAAANGALLGFLIFFLYYLGAHRIFFRLPAAAMTFTALFVLVLYLGSLGWISKLAQFRRRRAEEPCDEGMLHLRMLFPFAIPFLLFNLIIDLLQLTPKSWTGPEEDSAWGLLLFFGGLILFVGFVLAVIPFAIQWFWRCTDLPEGPKRRALEELCARLKFRHAGMKIWTLMRTSYTAAIVGVFPRFRYVMFTRRLLDGLSIEALQAILAHEIGHSARRHLLIYPLILFGMVAVADLFAALFSPAIESFFYLQEQLYPEGFWAVLAPIGVFVPFALILLLYFRFVFGYFSRLFERQADLHVYEAKLPPEDMIEALDHVGTLSGGIHRHPSWHHYSIQQRIDFLERTIDHPDLIEGHHRRVRRNVRGYFIILLGLICLLIAPGMREVQGFAQVAEGMDGISGWASEGLNGELWDQLAEKKLEAIGVAVTPELLEVMTQGLQIEQKMGFGGIANYYAAHVLYEQGELKLSAQFMQQAWEEGADNPEEIKEGFRELSRKIVDGFKDQGSEADNQSLDP